MAKPLFKSAKHELREPLANIIMALVGIRSELILRSEEHPEGLSMVNFADKARRAGIFVSTIEAEVDKLIIIDGNNTTKKE